MSDDMLTKGNPLKKTAQSRAGGKMQKLASQLRAAEKLNDALIGSIGDGVIVLDEYGLIREVNQSALRMLGYSQSEMVGQWLQTVLPSKDKNGNDIPAIDRPAVKSLMSGQPSTMITSYIRKNGTIFQVAGTASPFIIDGKPMGTVIVFRDVSREVAVERAKDEFVSLASHQLRTPLTSIRMYLQILRSESEQFSQEHKHYLQKIEGATLSMLELVDDFLSISKLELGKLELKLEPTDLSKLMIEQIGRVQNIADDNGIKISYRGKVVNPAALTDKRLLAEVIYNLTTNSIRYRNDVNPKISITLSETPNVFVLSVKDNGIGIPKEVENRIFERLYRAENAREIHSDGTGLGLYLVKKIVMALGGRISLKSTLGKGTTFAVELPKNYS